jgi:hypothetical protein
MHLVRVRVRVRVAGLRVEHHACAWSITARLLSSHWSASSMLWYMEQRRTLPSRLSRAQLAAFSSFSAVGEGGSVHG